jgi:hypothetical protein
MNRHLSINLPSRYFICAAIFALLAGWISLVDMKRDYRLIVESSTYEAYQVFYHMGPLGFSAPDSAKNGELIKGPTPGRNFYSIAFPVPDKPVNNIRIDPGTKAEKILFRSIRLEAGHFLTVHEWRAQDIVRDFKPWNDIGEFSEKNGVLTIESTGNDPYFLLPEEQTRVIFNKTPSGVKIMTWIIKVILILLVGFLVFYFASAMEILIRTCLDVFLFVIGRVIFYLKSLIVLGVTGGHGFHRVLFVVLFVVLITLPAVDAQFKFLPQAESTEKRTLAKRPVLDIKRLSSFPGEYEQYFNDHFGLRNNLVRWYSLLQFKWLKISPHPLIVMGENGWLFYGDEPTIRDYRGLLSYSDAELIEIQQRLDRDTATLRSRGIKFLIVVCPNKDTIYPEFMPSNITRIKESRRLDQLKHHLRASVSQVSLVDPRDPLIKTKVRYPVYNKLDAHFNFLGGLVTYNEIMRVLSADFPQVSPLTIDDYQISMRTIKGVGDLTYFSAIVGILPEVQVLLQPRGKPLPPKRISKLLVFHDSFVDYLRPYLVHDFDQIVYVHHADAYIGYAAIEKEKPDVVIFEIAERNLHALLAAYR